MRIGIDALSVVPRETGGGETYLRELLHAIERSPAAAGHEVLVYLSRNAMDLAEDGDIVRRREVDLDNRSRVRRLAYEHLRLGGQLRADGIDVVFAPGNALPLRLPCPSVLGVQSLHSFLVPEEMSAFRVHYFRRVVPPSARRADRVLCVSEDIRRTLMDVVPDLDPTKVAVVYEGAPQDIEPVTDPERIAEACARQRVEPGRFVLFVSSLNPFKRPERAVEAVARLRAEDGEDWPLVLAGRASEEHTARVMAAARDAGVEDLVRIPGTVNRADLSALFSSARAMVYPSTVETFGLPPLEAMACRCPVVAARRTSIPEIVGDAALLIDPDDVGEFAASLRIALHDEARRATMIERGLARVGRFTWADAATGTIRLIEAAAGARN